MLGWVRTILSSRFQFKFEKRSPNWGPRNLDKECAHRPTLTGEGINTHTDRILFKLFRPNFGGLNFFWTKTSFEQNIFRTKNFCRKKNSDKVFLTDKKFFLDQKFFLTQNFFRPNIYLDVYGYKITFPDCVGEREEEALRYLEVIWQNRLATFI